MIGKNVVVATKSRPWILVHGTLVEKTEDRVTLTHARCVVYFSTPTHGFIGLAVTGPMVGSRVSSAVDQIEIGGIEFTMLASAEASKAWEQGEWL